MLWRLATWSWQLMLGYAGSGYMPQHLQLLCAGCLYLSVISSTCMCIWYLAKAYRHRLWRRRKSVRPSQEIRTERRRIAQSLHDVLGSQLVYALSLCINKPDPVLQQILEQGLLNLRLIVDSMDGQDDALPMCMARFQASGSARAGSPWHLAALACLLTTIRCNRPITCLEGKLPKHTRHTARSHQQHLAACACP